MGGFFTHGYVLYEAGEVLSVREPYQFLRIGCSSRNWVAKVIISHRPCNWHTCKTLLPTNYTNICLKKHFLGRNNSVGIATRYGLDGPGIESRWEARFSAPVLTGPGAHLASSTMGTCALPGVKATGGWCRLPTPSSAVVKERVELYLYSPSGLSWPVLGLTFTFTFYVFRLPLVTILREQPYS